MMSKEKKRILQLSNVTIKSQANLQTIECFIKTQSIVIHSFTLLEIMFSQNKFILNIVILVIMLQTFLLSPLDELNFSYLRRCWEN